MKSGVLPENHLIGLPLPPPGRKASLDIDRTRQGIGNLNKSQYFYRNIVISKQGDKVSIVDINNPEKEALTFEPWLGLVVVLADGQHTIGELIDTLKQKYNGSPPAELERTIESVIERLTETQAIILTDEPVEMPYYLSMPAEQLNLDKARQLMAEDGHTDNSPKRH